MGAVCPKILLTSRGLLRSATHDHVYRNEYASSRDSHFPLAREQLHQVDLTCKDCRKVNTVHADDLRTATLNIGF